MKWFSNLFKKDVGSSGYNNLPSVSTTVPLPEVKPPKPEKNISEPVFAIVECMKKYPSRWKVKKDASNYIVTDIRSGELFQGRELENYWVFDLTQGIHNYVATSPKWLTRDESELLISQVRKISDIKNSRLRLIKNIRDEKDRQRMKEIYK